VGGTKSPSSRVRELSAAEEHERQHRASAAARIRGSYRYLRQGLQATALIQVVRIAFLPGYTVMGMCPRGSSIGLTRRKEEKPGGSSRSGDWS
jgi:hypothetical protein